MNILEVMLTSIKAKITPILNKIRLLMTPSYIKNKFLANLRNFFFRLFNVKPESQTDYYPFLGWLISKKLAMAVVVATGILCGGYILFTMPEKPRNESTYTTYKYNSIPLKFMSGKVQILGKSGYLAYVGDVEEGTVKGEGVLYNPAGTKVYEGAFDANAYNGMGKAYYDNSILKYEGNFKDNLYDGEGKLYRENGTLTYTGEFSGGYMEGEGQLYSASEEPVYMGKFQKDKILYPELLDKNVTEVAQMYTGRRLVYTGEDNYCVYMKDIAAIYFGEDGSNTLEEDFKVSGIYVLENGISMDGKWMETMEDVRKVLGTPIYEGNTLLSAKDEIALNHTCDITGEDALFGRAQCTMEDVFEDVFELKEYDKDYLAYLYVFEKDEIVYTFFCKDKEGMFDFYMMEL